MSAPAIPSALLSSATPSADAFDAIVQAANPSHPNHAAWIEKFGTNSPRRASMARDADTASNSHLEGSESPGRRRRRISSHNGSRAPIPKFPVDLDQYAGSGKGRSRGHSSGVDERSSHSHSHSHSHSGRKVQEEDVSEQEGRPSEELARRRRKKKRAKGKEKERSIVPPIPPPRTTSHAIQSSPVADLPPLPPTQPPASSPLPSYPSSSKTSPTPSRTHSNLSESSRPHITPRSPLRIVPSHSRSISAQLSSTSTLPGTFEAAANAASSARTSPVQGRREAETPSRLSSKAPRVVEHQVSPTATRTFDSASQIVSTPSVSDSRLVDFALPEEQPGRGSVDSSHHIRKSLDLLVSPFRNAAKSNTNKEATAPTARQTKKSSKSSILKSAYKDFSSYKYSVPSPPAQVSPTRKSYSREADANSIGNAKAVEMPEALQSHVVVEPEATKVPIHPISSYRPSSSGSPMEEKDSENKSAQSDVGGNGSSGEDLSHRSNGTISTIKKRTKKKSVDLQSQSAGMRTKSTALSDLAMHHPTGMPTVKGYSSDSDNEVPVAGHLSLQSMPLSGSVNSNLHDSSLDKTTSSMRQQSDSVSHDGRKGIEQTTADQPTEQSIYPSVPPTTETSWRERFDQYTMQSPSNPSTGHTYTDNAASSPMTSELLTASDLAHPSKIGVNQEEFPQQKSLGRSGGRAFAGVMARMRRDRSVSANQLRDSPKSEEAKYLEGDTPSLPFGLGIADPAGDAMEAPQKRWRNRLASFSGKSPKSPKIEEDWRADYIDAPLPPMPPKARQVLTARKYPGSTMEVDRDHNRQNLSLSQIALDKGDSQVRGMVNLGMGKKSGDFDRDIEPVTIHKTLSPALLINKRHEADEVVSFIGSDGDVDDKRATWDSLNKLETGSSEAVAAVEDDGSPLTKPITVQVTRPSTDARSIRDDFQQRGRDMPLTPPVRRSSFSRSRLASLAGEGRRGAPPSPYAADAPPLPSTPSPKLVPSPTEEQSPAPRRSMDHRIPTWARGLSRRSVSQLGASTSRGPSISLDRDQMPVEYQATSQTPVKGSIASPKVAKRFFSSASKSKASSKGISSNDFNSPYDAATASKSELSLGRIRSREDQNGSAADNRGLEGSRTLASQMKNMKLSSPPTNHGSRINSPLPPTPTATHHFTTEEETAAFDRMLRESAREDAARVKQIATRTAQAHAIRS